MLRPEGYVRSRGPGEVTTAFRRFACCDPGGSLGRGGRSGHHCLSAVRMLRPDSQSFFLWALKSPLPFGGSHAATESCQRQRRGSNVTTAFRRFACCDIVIPGYAEAVAQESPLPFGGSHAATCPLLLQPRSGVRHHCLSAVRMLRPTHSTHARPTKKSPLPFGGSHAATSRARRSPSVVVWSPLPFGGSHAATWNNYDKGN